MIEELKQIRKLIVDGKSFEALNMLDLIMANSPQLEENKELVSKCNQLEKEKMAQDDTIHELLKERTELTIENLQLLNQIADDSKKVERDADDSKTMENLRKMLEDECSRRCVLEKKLNLCIDAMQTVIDNTDEFSTKELLMNILEKVKVVK